MSEDQAADTGTKVGEQHPKKKRKNQTRTGPEKEAEVRKGRNGQEEHPGKKIGGQEVQTGVRPETLIEADALEAEAVGEIAAKIGLLRERTEAEIPPAGGEDEAAAAPTMTEQIKRRTEKVPIPQGGIDPETGEAQPDQIVQKIEKIARKIIRALAPPLTATDFFYGNPNLQISFIHPSFFQISHKHRPFQTGYKAWLIESEAEEHKKIYK